MEMDDSLNKPKGFAEILDETFRLCKNHFSKLFMVFLVLLGPIYLLQAIVLLLTGTSFFRAMGNGNTWLEQMISGLYEGTDTTGYVAQAITTLFLGLASIVLVPVAYASILFIIDHLKDKQEFTVKSSIKRAFSRFWPIFGSTLLFGLIAIGMFVGLFILVMMVSGILGFAINGVTGGVITVIVIVLLFLGAGVVIALLLTRWSLFLGGTSLEKAAPGLSRSWQLTRNRTWKTLGLFLVLSLITGIINSAVQGVLIFALGNSVLYTIITDLVGMFTSMIIAVAYAVIYFDLKTRHDADDLKELLEDYEGAGN